MIVDHATAQRHLGELAVMSNQTQQTERRIVARANELLAAAQKERDETRVAAQAGDAEAGRRYQAAIEEIGRCERVIAQAREHLGEGNIQAA